MIQPNIVLIFSDDMEFSYLGCHGSEILQRMIGMYEDWAKKAGALRWPVNPESPASPCKETKHIHDV